MFNNKQPALFTRNKLLFSAQVELACLLKILTRFILFYLLLSSNQLQAETLKLAAVETSSYRGFDYVNVMTSGYIKAKGILLDNKLLVDFPNCKVNALKIATVEAKYVRAVYARQVKPSVAQLVIELSGSVDYEIVNIFGRDKTVIEIANYSNYTAKLMAAWEKENLRQKGDILKALKYPPLLTGTDHSLKGKIIVLDPGHGGCDPGAIASSGMLEKQITLQTAKKAAQMLSRSGATVYLTRGDDRRINLGDIADFANQIGADAFISIHYNTSTKTDTSGTETYYYNSFSQGLGRIVHASLLDELGRKDRGLHREMFYTIHHTTMPAVLIEPVFISNGDEEELAMSTVFQQKVALAITKGVKNYF